MLVGLWFSRKFWPALLDHLGSARILAYNSLHVKQEGRAEDRVVYDNWHASSSTCH